MTSNGATLDNDGLTTLMCEVEAIINSRPLTSIDDVSVVEPLTPNHLLTLKSKVILSPPGIFDENDAFCRKRWRHIQHLANVFWQRYRTEYMHSLTTRNKWNHKKRNFSVNDIVLIKDDGAPRNQWKIAKVIEVFPSADKLVRKVKVILGTNNLLRSGKRLSDLAVLERPVSQLVLLVEASPPKVI